jgi:hypothetical protein
MRGGPRTTQTQKWAASCYERRYEKNTLFISDKLDLLANLKLYFFSIHYSFRIC